MTFQERLLAASRLARSGVPAILRNVEDARPIGVNVSIFMIKLCIAFFFFVIF